LGGGILLLLACHKPSRPISKSTCVWVCAAPKEYQGRKKGFCGIFKSPALESDFGGLVLLFISPFSLFFSSFMLMKITSVWDSSLN
jgi:hypothetical protein